MSDPVQANLAAENAMLQAKLGEQMLDVSTYDKRFERGVLECLHTLERDMKKVLKKLSKKGKRK